jgi:hypothetical protein
MAHTPGPWEADIGHQLEEWPMDQVIVYDDSHGCIAEVDCHTDWATTQANARLIAAAPDLLEAAKLMLGYGPGKMPDGRDTYDVLRDAVARAEGEPTCEHTSCTQRGADWVCDACHAKVRL